MVFRRKVSRTSKRVRNRRNRRTQERTRQRGRKISRKRSRKPKRSQKRRRSTRKGTMVGGSQREMLMKEMLAPPPVEMLALPPVEMSQTEMLMKIQTEIAAINVYRSDPAHSGDTGASDLPKLEFTEPECLKALDMGNVYNALQSLLYAHDLKEKYRHSIERCIDAIYLSEQTGYMYKIETYFRILETMEWDRENAMEYLKETIRYFKEKSTEIYHLGGDYTSVFTSEEMIFDILSQKYQDSLIERKSISMDMADDTCCQYAIVSATSELQGIITGRFDNIVRQYINTCPLPQKVRFVDVSNYFHGKGQQEILSELKSWSENTETMYFLICRRHYDWPENFIIANQSIRESTDSKYAQYIQSIATYGGETKTSKRAKMDLTVKIKAPYQWYPMTTESVSKINGFYRLFYICLPVTGHGSGGSESDDLVCIKLLQIFKTYPLRTKQQHEETHEETIGDNFYTDWTPHSQGGGQRNPEERNEDIARIFSSDSFGLKYSSEVSRLQSDQELETLYENLMRSGDIFDKSVIECFFYELRKHKDKGCQYCTVKEYNNCANIFESIEKRLCNMHKHRVGTERAQVQLDTARRLE